MRTLRRPLKAKFENRSSSTTSGRFSGISKPKKLQKSLNSLTTFLTRFDQVDHTIFETVTTLNSFICDILNSTQKHPSHVNYTEFLNTWTKIKTQLSNNIITLNNTQMTTLIEKELNAFMSIINQVESNPPTSQKQQRDSKTIAKGISNVINSAKESSRRKQFDKLKIQMQNLRNDLSFQYEPFFKFSQINKEWKNTIVDDCRRSLDKVINFCDVGKDLGLTQFPFVDEISILLSELANESEIMKDNAKSLIPRHSPMKYEQRKAVDLAENEEKTPLKSSQSKIKKVPNSARSKSEQSSKISRIPKPKEQTTPDRSMASKKVRSSLSNKNLQISDSESSRSENTSYEKKTKQATSARVSKKETIKPPPTSKAAREESNNKPKPALSRSQKPVRSSSTSHSTKTSQKVEPTAKENNTKKKEIVPLQESPKIQRKQKPKNALASSQQIAFKKLKLNSEEESSANSEQTNENNEQVTHFNINNNDDSIENTKNDLFSFEQRFIRYVATVGTSDLLGRFVNEIRMTQKAIESDQNNLSQHVTRLNNLMNQIEEQINISKPMFEIEQNLSQALNQMSNLSDSMVNSVASNAELAEANAIFKQYQLVKEKLEKVAFDRNDSAENELSSKIQTELAKFQEAESTFRNAQENNETLKRLRKENIEMRKEMQNLNCKNDDHQNSEKYQKILIEMKAVNQRMAEIQIEKKENPDDIEEIDAELEALIEQQSGLIDQLNSFQF